MIRVRVTGFGGLRVSDRAVKSRVLPSYEAGVEELLVYAYLAARILNLLQLLPSLPYYAPRSPNPALDLAVAATFTVWAAVTAVVLLRRKSLRSAQRMLAVDVAVSWLALLAAPWIVPPVAFQTWGGWPYPVTLLTAAIAVAAFRRSVAAVVVVGLSLTYAAEWLHLRQGSDLVTIASNALSYLAFAAVMFVIVSVMRSLGRAADDGHAAVARLAIDGQRNLLHTLDNVLAIPVQVNGSDELMAAYDHDVRQARQSLRALLNGQSRRPSPTAVEMLRILAGYRDLNLSVSFELFSVSLPDEQNVALAEGVRAALQNVRAHSDATSVRVVGAVADNGWWVSVRDDGKGFDPSTAHTRVGVRELLGQDLTEVGLTSQVSTELGVGTLVMISGPMPAKSGLGQALLRPLGAR